MPPHWILVALALGMMLNRADASGGQLIDVDYSPIEVFKAIGLHTKKWAEHMSCKPMQGVVL
jgi:hypothetical protein